MTDKPFKGTIDDWYMVPCPPKYGLGYYVKGISIDHPEFAGQHMFTSYVVAHEGNQIETRNSIYLLGEELGAK